MVVKFIEILIKANAILGKKIILSVKENAILF